MSSEAATGYDPNYEITRATDDQKMVRKLRLKRTLYRWIGEVYVGKRVKLAYFHDWLRRIPLPPEPRVLEVGSGDGLFCFAAADQLARSEVTGLELNPTEARSCGLIAQAEGRTRVRFVPGLLQDQNWRDRFDFVFCLDVLEHIKDDVSALAEMWRAMKPGASLLIHVPNRYYQEPDGTMHTMPDEEAWRVNPGHVRQGYTPDQLRAAIEAAGFEVRVVEQTQGYHIAKAHRLYGRVERFLPGRIAILPLIDRRIRCDRRSRPAHGNTVWAWAQKPPGATAP